MKHLKYQRGEMVAGVTIGTARENWRSHVAAACTDLRLHCIPPRSDWGAERELFRSGVAEILSLRLLIAYMPLLQGLQRIENRVDILVNMREAPYAPPVKRREDGYLGVPVRG